MLQIYYGNGTGKTNACIGCALKSAMRERKILFVSFIADADSEYGKSLNMLFGVSVITAPVDANVAIEESPDKPLQASRVFREMFDTATRTALTQKYDVLIFDGIFDIITKKFLCESEVYEFLSNAPDSIEIVCTGCDVSEKFISLADYTTLFSNTKLIPDTE